MSDEATLPRPAVHGIAFGLIFMAVVTVAWSSLAGYGWRGIAAWLPPALAAVAAVAFVVNGVRLIANARRFPPPTAPEDVERARRTGRDYGIVFGTEGVLIAITSIVLARLGRQDDNVPAIALIVGLHFAPMARIFDRTVDYWISAWVSLVGVAGLVAIHAGATSVPAAWSAVGVGTALGTAAYGVYMSRDAADALRRLPEQVPA